MDKKIQSIHLIDNYLYFGTKGRIYRFNISDFEPIRYKNKLQKFQIELNNGTIHSYNISEKIELSHTEKSITINANPLIFSNWKNKAYQSELARKING